MSSLQDNAAWAHMLVTHLGRPCVISPGSRSAPLVLAATALPAAQVHCVLDERAAGFFALGLARATGQAVVLICTSGSAAAHYLPAIIEANASHIPLVVLTADRPPELHRCGAPQTIDQNRLFGAHVRWFADLGAPGGGSHRWLRTVVAQALDRAEGVEPGPVHLNVPFREPLWAPGSAAPAGADVAPARILRGPPRLDAPWVKAVAQRLAAEPHGVVVAGVRAPTQNDAALAAMVGQLAARLGWPVLAEPTSQLRTLAGPALAETLVTAHDALLRDETFASAHAPRLVLRLGQFPTSKVVGQWLGCHGIDRTILVDPHGAWSDPTHAADVLLVAEPRDLIAALLHQVPQTTDRTWLHRWQVAEKQARACLDHVCASALSEPAVAAAVVRSVPRGGALYVASSMPIRDLDSFAPAAELAYFTNRGANGIDGTLACALGTARGWHQGPTAVLLGDLAFLHDVGALQLARQRDIPLTAVVVNNGGGGIFDFLPIAQHPTAFASFFRTPQVADLAALARSAGAQVSHVTSLAALNEALAASWQLPGLKVIEVKVGQGDNVQQHQAAWHAVRDAVNATRHTRAASGPSRNNG